MKHATGRTDIILHIAFQSDWEDGLRKGEYQAPSLSEEGFIHASKDKKQMDGVLARLFSGRTDLLVLEIDTCRLQENSQVIWEAASTGEIYPHIYGSINLGAVIRVQTLAPDPANPQEFQVVDTE